MLFHYHPPMSILTVAAAAGTGFVIGLLVKSGVVAKT
jgi:hypothetical protein